MTFALDNTYRPKRKKQPVCGTNPNRVQKKLIDDCDWEPGQTAMFPEQQGDAPPSPAEKIPPAQYCDCCGTTLELGFCRLCPDGCAAGDECCWAGLKRRSDEHYCALCDEPVEHPDTTPCGQFHPACAEKHAAQCEACQRDHFPR